jgi:beta-lactamase class A
MRFALVLLVVALGLSGCQRNGVTTPSTTPQLDMATLDRDIAVVALRAQPGVLGVGLMNLENGQTWVLNGERRFPMQSVFKAPMAAAALAEVDAGRLHLDEVITLTEKDLSTPLSPIADAWPGRTTYTVGELLTAAVVESDNTAADVLMKKIGGPGAVSAWLSGKRVDEVRVDRYERELQPDTAGMASFRLAWKGEAAYAAAIASIPPARRHAAAVAYLADPRDTATPQGMLNFLYKLEDGQLLSPTSTKLLLGLMTRTRTGNARLKAGLPATAVLAHKAGTGRTDQGMNLATNDIGVVTLPDGRRYAIAVFLAGSTLKPAAREAAIADVARSITRGVR